MHNLYFPWIRILIMIVMFYCLYHLSFYLDLQLANIELQSEDFDGYNRRREQLDSDIQYLVNGENQNYRNIIALEPYLLPMDFYSEKNFYNAMRPVLEKAKTENAIDRKTLVVFPEHIGTGLVLLGEKKPVFFAKNLTSAIEVLENQYNQIPNNSETKEEYNSRIGKSGTPLTIKDILKLKSPLMARAYHNTFSKLALEYNVSIIAGSILIANPEIKNGEFISETGDIYNATVVYLGTGKAINPIIKKITLNRWESKFAEPGSMDQELQVKVPGWTVGVLIGEDSLIETNYKTFGTKKLDGIVSPASSFYELDWKSLIGHDPSSHESKNFLWLEYGIRRWIHHTKAKVHLQVFWKGEIGNIIPGGESFTTDKSLNLMQSGNKPAPKVLNLYF